MPTGICVPGPEEILETRMGMDCLSDICGLLPVSSAPRVEFDSVAHIKKLSGFDQSYTSDLKKIRQGSLPAGESLYDTE